MQRFPPILPPLLALTLSLAASSDARACSCALPPPFAEAVERSDAIFLGEVLAIESTETGDSAAPIWAVFRVDRSWKGDPPQTTRVMTAASSVSCGFRFVPGTRYLVYAFRGGTGLPEDPNGLHTNLCWRTHASSPGDPDLAALDGMKVVGFRAPFPSPSSGDVAFEYTLVDRPIVFLDVPLDPRLDIRHQHTRHGLGRVASHAMAAHDHRGQPYQPLTRNAAAPPQYASNTGCMLAVTPSSPRSRSRPSGRPGVAVSPRRSGARQSSALSWSVGAGRWWTSSHTTSR